MPTPTLHDPNRRTVVYSRKGETVRPCQASPHCHNLVGKRHVDANGFAMCPSCATDYDANANADGLDTSEVVAAYRDDPEGKPSGY